MGGRDWLLRVVKKGWIGVLWEEFGGGVIVWVMGYVESKWGKWVVV